ncbi:MAG: DNA polymerase [Candidatus Paceibacterota bacterium]
MPKKTIERKKRLVLLDAHAILHRAYHALPDFTSHSGEPTGALYGLSAMLMKIITDLKPDYIAACFDLPEPTYRHEAYENYKAGRAKTDEVLVRQINRSRDVFEAFSIPIYEKPGFEADDMLGTIVEQTKDNKELEIVIASGDMDTLQLVEKKKVQVYTLRKGLNDTILYDENAVKERFGFSPERLPDYKGLRGDPSDNIIGISGIGDKTATELITTFGSIENIYKKLKKEKEAFEREGFKPRIIKLLEEGEEEAYFSKELATIRKDAKINFSLPKKEWRDEIKVDSILTLFSELSFRTLSERAKQLFGKESGEDGGSDKEEEGEEEYDEELLGKVSVGVWLLDSEMTNPNYDDVMSFTKAKDLKEAEKKVCEMLEKEKLLSLYKEIELPLIPVIQKMEKRGVFIDSKYLKELSKEYHKELEEIEKKIYKEAKEEFNINSPRQLGVILYEKLGLKTQKKTATGQKSTRESELEKLKDEHAIIEQILQYRELQKLLSTYIDTIPESVNVDGRLHATFVQTGTTTGRMASINPNLQNIPIRSEHGKKIRNAFVAPPGFVIVAFDYSQIELRVAAFLSGDKKLINIFKEKGDVHTAVAAEVFGVPPEQVDKEMRRRAKVINFGILYGMGVNALRVNLGTDRKEAQEFLNEYFKNFSGLARYLDHVKSETARKKYTETFFGRKRYFEGISSSLPYVRAQAERMAINAPIQGTSADIIRIAMVRIDEMLKKKKYEGDAHLVLQIHDELVYEIKEEKEKEIAEEIETIMENIIDVKETSGVPIIVDAHVGKNWGEMKKLNG